ncbi:MAG TPA: homoprotocatechuate degradation operon regulator HpaR [Burkholderiaceae bacterium]|nr:homoprotocatechuate degradation operon regulator HpaR [Burkholderiaceae bacterium]
MPATALRHRNLPHLLLRSREALMAHFRPLLAEQGLTEQQWRIVREVVEQGPLEPRQLCEACSISSPSIVGVLARMEETGLVTRARMAHDQRRVKVSLTPKGRRIAAKLVPLIEQRYESLERALGLRSIQEVYDALDALLARTPRAAGAAPDD